MPADTLLETTFDHKLAAECAASFSVATGLGCAVTDTAGAVLFGAGYNCATCGVCAAAGQDAARCGPAHAYGMAEAERFGGKYIYYCPLGLTCFVSPIIGALGSAAKITAGPFLLGSLEDYVTFDLEERLKLDGAQIAALLPELRRLPAVQPDKVNAFANLLFMSAGFMNDVSAANRMTESRASGDIQGQISQYILALKDEGGAPGYPVDVERALLAAIADADKPTAQKLLNELLGHVLFETGGSLPRIKARIQELLTLISRAAISAGASPDATLRQTQEFYQKCGATRSIEDLCLLLSGTMSRFIDSAFQRADIKHADAMHKAARFLRENCAQKLSLNDVAAAVGLSPSYFSRVFRREMDCPFSAYLNGLRVAKAKDLLLHSSLRLADIAAMTGFEDQSYFTKVFKRTVGAAPKRFRETGGRTSNKPQITI